MEQKVRTNDPAYKVTITWEKMLQIPGNMIMSSAPLLRKLNWLPVKQLLYLRDSNMAEKCLNNLVPTYLRDKYCKRSTIHSLVSMIPSKCYWSLKQLLVSKHLFIELVTSETIDEYCSANAHLVDIATSTLHLSESKLGRWFLFLRAAASNADLL